jgi:hypothetical protein
VVTKDAHREADRRIQGATRSLAWGIGAIVIVSPQTGHVTSLERLFGFRHSKSLDLGTDGPCSLAGDRVTDNLWVGCTNGDLVRMTNTELQPAEVGRVDMGHKVAWVAMGYSAMTTGRLRDSAARIRTRSPSPDPDHRVVEARSDLLVFAPSATGIRVFNATQPGMLEVGEIQGVPSYEAGAFDPATGCLYLASARGEGAVILVNPNNTLTTRAMLSFPQVQGAIQARVIGTALHVICEARNRWLTWDITDPENPVLLGDDTYDVGLYWERNPVRWVTATGELLRRSDSWLDFVPANWPVTDGGTAYQAVTDEPFRWALHGEIGQITWDQRRGVLPFRVFNTGGLTRQSNGVNALAKVGGMPRPAGTIDGPLSPVVVVETEGGFLSPVTESAAYDVNDEEVFSRVDSRNPNELNNPIPVSYYDCIEGLTTHDGGRSEQYPSDGTNIVRTQLRYSVRSLRARVSTGATATFTPSLSGFFQNPADPPVTITRYYSDENKLLVVELAAAVPVGQIITIQESNYPSGTTEMSGLVRKVPPAVSFTLDAAGSRTRVPAPEAGYTTDSSGHTPGIYRLWWKSGSFFDGVNYFVFNRDGVSQVVVRTAPSGIPPVVVEPSWTPLTAVVDANSVEAVAQALAAAQTALTVTIASPAHTILMAGLLNPPPGCTGSVEVYLEMLSPWPYP